MKTLTRDEAMTELAALPGHSELVAKNILFEATKNPYLTLDQGDGGLFIAATRDRRFLFADVQMDGGYPWPDGAAFAALLNEATAAGAYRVGERSPLPGWC